MDLTAIPFVEHVGIYRLDKETLALKLKQNVYNHLGTVCAGAQYTLAETASANVLQIIFPELVGTTIPVIRETKIKFRKPAESSVTARASVSEADAAAFMNRYKATGRGIIKVDVVISDEDGDTTCTGTYTWFLQRLVTAVRSNPPN